MHIITGNKGIDDERDGRFMTGDGANAGAGVKTTGLTTAGSNRLTGVNVAAMYLPVDGNASAGTLVKVTQRRSSACHPPHGTDARYYRNVCPVLGREMKDCVGTPCAPSWFHWPHDDVVRECACGHGLPP